MRRLILREAAEAEVEEAYHWYESQRTGLGAEFLQVLEAGLAITERSPEAFPTKYSEARQLALRRFPYSIFYLIQPDGASRSFPASMFGGIPNAGAHECAEEPNPGLQRTSSKPSALSRRPQ